MAILNYVKREIVAKIVYYGPGLSGKTLNIQKVHENMDPQNVGELTSLATESDRTLFFDFVPIQLGKIAGLETRFQLFTVPGQVFYNQTRRRVLEDADGVVFVADSQPEQLENNLESLANLEENLAFYGKKLSDVPFVIQFNKQDIPGCMTEDELNKVLNKYNAPAIRASCFENFGVMETLAKISTTVLAHLREQMTRKAAPNAPPTGIKRTYSKEGVSDEQVVKNLLEDIAASGGIAEAQAAGDIKPPAAPLAKPATPPVAPPKPIAPAAAGVPKPPAPRPAVAPKPIVPGAAPAPSAPRPAAAPAGPALSAEDLLSDLDSPAPAPKPTAPPRPPSGPAPAANKPGPAPVAPPRPTPSAAAPRPAVPAPKPPVPPPSSAPRPMASGPVPTAPVTTGGQTNAGLRMGGTPPPRPSPPPARTADELLESMERSTDAGLEQENGGGSFDTARNKKKTGNPLWDSDDEEPATAAMNLKPASILDDIDESAGEGKTNVANVGGMMRGGDAASPAPVPASKKPAPSSPGGDSTAGALFDAPELRVSSVGAPARGEDGSLEFDVQISDGTRDVPVRLVIPQAALKGIAGPSKSGGGGALFLGILNLLLLLGLGTFNVLVFLGMIER